MLKNKLYEVNEFIEEYDEYYHSKSDDFGVNTNLYYYDGEYFGVFLSWKLLQTTIKKNSFKLIISETSCQFLLSSGFIVPPYTMYENLFVLSLGDELHIDFIQKNMQVTSNFKWLEKNATHSNIASEDTLLKFLTKATDKIVDDDRKTYFMQSSGKDSAGILLGLKHSGKKDITCLTYNANFREDEAGLAAQMAEEYGYKHIRIDSSPEDEIDVFLDYCKEELSINIDFAFIPYLYSLHVANIEPDSEVIDGMGNDVYVGHIHSSIEKKLKNMSLAKIIPSLHNITNGPFISEKMSYIIKSLCMLPSERSLSGSRMSFQDINQIFNSYPTKVQSYFQKIEKIYDIYDEVDNRSFIRGRLLDFAAGMEKAKAASMYFQSTTIFPYCNEELADYYFNLPIENKYDLSKYKNKLLLRNLLHKHFKNYDKYLMEKGSFRFDVATFMKKNKNKIALEIKEASSIYPALENIYNKYTKHLDNYVYASMTYQLFVFSAWLNRRNIENKEYLGQTKKYEQEYTLVIFYPEVES